MDVKVNTDLIKQLRNKRAQSQEELAAAAGLSLRTVQRIESEGIASLESKKAIAGVFGIDSADLDDTREEKAEKAKTLQREVRNGYAGAWVGGACALIAIGYSFFTGGISAQAAGIYSAVVAVGVGASCVFITTQAKRRAHA